MSLRSYDVFLPATAYTWMFCPTTERDSFSNLRTAEGGRVDFQPWSGSPHLTRNVTTDLVEHVR
jgi:hypothetical protein